MAPQHLCLHCFSQQSQFRPLFCNTRYVRTPYALPELEFPPWSQQVSVWARVVVEVIAVSPRERVHRGWKSLQAAVWPPSAKVLGQGVGQQESGFQHYRKSPKRQDFPVANKCALTASGFFLP